MSGVCPSCGAEQGASLLCNTCTTRLERDLGDVAAIVTELDVSMSKQARIGNGGSAGLARERSPLNVGAMNAADELANVLTTWARDLFGESAAWISVTDKPSQAAARALLSDIPTIRKHPAVVELVDQIERAISKARWTVDRPADRVYLGQCHHEVAEVVCMAELYASPGASEVRCKVCGVTHPVAERRAWLLQRASDMLFTAAEASQMLGEIGHITVTQASIRGYIHRGKIAYRAPVVAKRIRLGDLLAVVMDDSERRTA